MSKRTTPESMHIDRYERNWIRFSVILLIIFVGAVAIAGFAFGFHVPSPEVRVDPNALDQDPVWSNPGVREIAPGAYEAHIVASMFRFDPANIEVPVGSTITFHVTSSDLQHGFKLQDTNVNMQIVPGEVSTLTITLDEAGEYPYICTEYCGTGHAVMFGSLTVVGD